MKKEAFGTFLMFVFVGFSIFFFLSFKSVNADYEMPLSMDIATTINNNFLNVSSLPCAEGQVARIIDGVWACYSFTNSSFDDLDIAWTGTFGYGNLSVCAEDQILKISGGIWTCSAEAGATGNTSAQVIAVVNITNLLFNFNASGVNCAGIVGATSNLCTLVDTTGSGNTSAEMIATINKSQTFNIQARNVSDYIPWSQITDKGINIDFGNVSGKGINLGRDNLTGIGVTLPWGNITGAIIYNSSYEWFDNTTLFLMYNSSYEWFNNVTIFLNFNSSYDAMLNHNTTQEIVDAVNKSDLHMNDKNIFDVGWLNASNINGTYYGDGSNLILSTSYFAVNITTDKGTHTGGNLASITTAEDDLSYNVTEATGASPLIVVINFTAVTTFDSVVGRIYYSGKQGHEVQLEILRSDTGVWENYLEFTDMTSFINFYVPVLDPAQHVDTTRNNNVSLRFNHAQNGISSHTFKIDYIALVDGLTTLTTSQHDGLSGRDNISNHPWAFPTEATRNITGNVNITRNLDVDGYINASDWTDVSILWSQVNGKGIIELTSQNISGLNWSTVTDKGITGIGDVNMSNVSYDKVYNKPSMWSYATNISDKPSLWNFAINVSNRSVNDLNDRNISGLNYSLIQNKPQIFSYLTNISDKPSNWDRANLTGIGTANQNFNNLTANLAMRWENLSTFNLNSAWTGTLGFKNLTNYDLNVSWSNTLGYGNLSKCAEGEILKISSSAWVCSADAGGTNYWEVQGAWLTPNITAGAKNFVNATGFNASQTINASVFWENGVLLEQKYKAAGGITNINFASNVTNRSVNDLTTSNFTANLALGFKNMTGFDFNVSWSNSLGGGNITHGTLDQDAFISTFMINKNNISGPFGVNLNFATNVSNRSVNDLTTSNFTANLALGFKNLTNFDFNVSWANTLHGGNITHGTLDQDALTATFMINKNNISGPMGGENIPWANVTGGGMAGLTDVNITGLNYSLVQSKPMYWDWTVNITNKGLNIPWANITGKGLNLDRANLTGIGPTGLNNANSTYYLPMNDTWQATNAKVLGNLNISGSLNVTNKINLYNSTICWNLPCTVNITYNGTHIIEYG